MQKQIIHYVRTCVNCQIKKRAPGKKVGFFKTITVDQPFEKVSLNLIGPCQQNKSGNRFVIIAVDYVTIEQSIHGAGTKEVVDFFVKRGKLQHGAPLSIIADRVKCLKLVFAEELFRALQTYHLV